MLYKFKSKAAADVIMLEPNGRQILQIIGKNDADQLIKGILLPEDMPAAIVALERAISQTSQPTEEDEDGCTNAKDIITLRQRALPFIDMLHKCHVAGKEVVWGV